MTRTGATEEGDARRRVERLLVELPVPAGEQLSFEHPWELRAFALAVAAYHAGQYDWSAFQLALTGAIRRQESQGEDVPWGYYQHWLEALEAVLSERGVLEETELEGRARTVLATPRDAHHQHAHREPVTVDPARSSPSP